MQFLDFFFIVLPILLFVFFLDAFFVLQYSYNVEQGSKNASKPPKPVTNKVSCKPRQLITKNFKQHLFTDENSNPRRNSDFGGEMLTPISILWNL